MKKYYCEHTEYSKLFCKVEWGQLVGKPEANIVQNRNTLAKEFKLEKALKRNSLFMYYKLYDHPEFYRSLDGKKYLIQSTYNDDGPLSDHLIAREIGKSLIYKEIKPIYASQARSFLAEIKEKN